MSERKITAVSLVFDFQGHVLCVWNNKLNGWTLPGGKVEPDETIIEAQERELREETGLETLVASCVYTNYCTIETDRLVHVFLAAPKGTPAETEPGKPVLWLTQEELVAKSPFSDYYKQMFAALINL